MKVGPEQVLSICIALELYAPAAAGGEEEALSRMLASLAIVPGVEFAIASDEAGREIRRLRVSTPRAVDVVRRLRDGDPPIYTRAHHAAEGYFFIDPRNLRADDVDIVTRRLQAALVSD
jgi:L-seryl-tRNA(Ser) seleniumtransferase